MMPRLLRVYKVACVQALAEMVGMDGKPNDYQLDHSIEVGLRAAFEERDRLQQVNKYFLSYRHVFAVEAARQAGYHPQEPKVILVSDPEKLHGIEGNDRDLFYIVHAPRHVMTATDTERWNALLARAMERRLTLENIVLR